MSRFLEFSLSKRTDELLKPAEKSLHKEFNTNENQQLVYKTVITQIDSRASFRSVMDEMGSVFRSAISGDSLPSVEDMNRMVYQRMSNSLRREDLHTKRYVSRTFENSNLPRTFLPRPSMDLDVDSQESRGKHLIEFNR